MSIDPFELIKASTIEISKPDRGTVKARASINLGNAGIIVRGFIIGEAEDGTLWCVAPRIQIKGRDVYIFWTENQDVWKFLTRQIIDEYERRFVNPGMMTDRESEKLAEEMNSVF